MARPVSGTAKTSAERVAALRDRKAQRGEPRRSVELTPDNAAKADREAITRGGGSTRTSVVNDWIAEA